MKTLFISLLISICIHAMPQNIDIRMLDALNTSNKLMMDEPFQFISNTETFVTIAVPATLGIISIATRDTVMFENTLFICMSTVAANGISYILKKVVNRPRPFDTYAFIYKKSDGGSPSFPSGHTTAAFATATSLSLAYPKWYVVVPSYLWASSVAYSRLHLGVHYPSDVAGGIIVAVSSTYVSYKLNNWLIGKVKKKKSNWFL